MLSGEYIFFIFRKQSRDIQAVKRFWKALTACRSAIKFFR